MQVKLHIFLFLALTLKCFGLYARKILCKSHESFMFSARAGSAKKPLLNTITTSIGNSSLKRLAIGTGGADEQQAKNGRGFVSIEESKYVQKELLKQLNRQQVPSRCQTMQRSYSKSKGEIFLQELDDDFQHIDSDIVSNFQNFVENFWRFSNKKVSLNLSWLLRRSRYRNSEGNNQGKIDIRLGYLMALFGAILFGQWGLVIGGVGYFVLGKTVGAPDWLALGAAAVTGPLMQLTLGNPTTGAPITVPTTVLQAEIEAVPVFIYAHPLTTGLALGSFILAIMALFVASSSTFYNMGHSSGALTKMDDAVMAQDLDSSFDYSVYADPAMKDWDVKFDKLK
eukprot:CAMPEP_0113939836 /NCGR_PEP_ID=MMETSP1339-20121228/6086_1 /TAXON_ID=94617 /ORGANISM="Fibrocapsa japonica" /LENGTH=339 /DNA_ID=CAMNT_0000943455 /DNA_START=24 /DNA_END=1043 /DNA_ORIENTATION=+ /assembly_acc=CAM_ASM_000762